MQYAIIVYETEADFAKRKDPNYVGAYAAYGRALAEAGIVRAGAGLMPTDTATTVRVRDGKRQVQDGPFADTKERLGGVWVIDVPDLDKALEWAARCPAASNACVEVRPTLPPLNT